MSGDPRINVSVETEGQLEGPIFVLKTAAPTLAPNPYYDGELTLYLDCEVEQRIDKDRPKSGRVMLAFETVDPYIIAADILGMADVILRRAAIDEGLDLQAQERVVRRARNVNRRARRKLVDAAEKAGGLSCSSCPRTARMIVDGVRYCKRCAEEAGVRPHGKIGGES